MISAKIVADSICNGNRITTMEVVFPRFILAELNTHRLFSRNSASSRAIPFEKMLKSVEENPFIPIAWQKDHKGMQGTEYLTNQSDIDYAIYNWKEAGIQAIKQAKFLNSRVTKQLCNRLLEPFMWHKVLITSTEFENFFNIRCPLYYAEPENKYYKSKKDFVNKFWNPTFTSTHVSENMNVEDWSTVKWLLMNEGQSEIHMMALAEAMWDAYNESTPKELQPGEWHIPYGDNIDPSVIFHKVKEDGQTFMYVPNELLDGKEQVKELQNLQKLKISTARCARLSYQTLGDNPKIDYEADIKLHDILLKDGHYSPFEHCAKAMSDEEYGRFFKGERNISKEGNDYFTELENVSETYYPYAAWCNNFKGFIQYRYLIESGK